MYGESSSCWDQRYRVSHVVAETIDVQFHYKLLRTEMYSATRSYWDQRYRLSHVVAGSIEVQCNN